MNHPDPYQKWLEHRRRDEPEATLADTVMAAVQKSDVSRRRSVAALLAAIAATRWGRAAICSTALLTGMTPYLLAIIGLYLS